jgi:hypothetical protein
MTSWLVALDALQLHVDLQTELLEAGRYDEVTAFIPPTDLPMLPGDLTDRAFELLSRTDALTGRGRAQRDDTGSKLAQPGRLAFAHRAVSAYVDQQA